MKKWAQGLKQWARWLVGEAPTPNRSAGLMLGATVVVVALLGSGTAFALENPSPSPKGARSADAALYKAALAQKKASRHQTTATTQPKKKKQQQKTSKTVITRRERAAEYEKALSLVTSEKPHHRVKRTGTKVRVRHTYHHVNTGAYKQTRRAST